MGWPYWVTTGIAVAALIGSVALPLRLDRRHDPKVTVTGSKAYCWGDDDFEGHCYRVMAMNSGRMPIMVKSAGWLVGTADVDSESAWEVSSFDFPRRSRQTTPALLEAHQDLTFAANMDALEVKASSIGQRITWLRAFIDLPNDKRVFAKETFAAREPDETNDIEAATVKATQLRTGTDRYSNYE